MLSLLSVTCFFALRFQGAKASLEIALEDAYISIADPEFFDPDHTEILVEPNDDGINAVFGQIKVINNSFDLEITYAHFIMSEYSMGKYNKRTGIDFTLKMCEMLGEPVLVGPFVSAMGLDEQCPPEPGVYEMKGYMPPDDAFPDTFGENKYELAFQIFTKDKTLLAMKIFIEMYENK